MLTPENDYIAGVVDATVAANVAVDSYDLVSTLPVPVPEPTAIGLRVVSFGGGGTVEVRVYDVNETFLGAITVPADEDGSFIGSLPVPLPLPGGVPPAIGRVNIWDAGAGNEGLYEVTFYGFCGNGFVDPGENCDNCPQDVLCPLGTECVGGKCQALCGNGQVDPGENCANRPADVPCPPGTKCVGGVCQAACPWDCEPAPDGNVGIVDFLELLSQWGMSGSCDFDGGGVGILDFLELLANWGDCP